MAVLRSDSPPEACRLNRQTVMPDPNTMQVSNASFPQDPHAQLRPPAETGASGARPYRLAILVSHPVQYFAPLFRRLAQQPEIDLTVLYCSLYGAKTVKDPGFGMTITWDIPLLEGYRYKELKNYWRGQPKGFFSYISPGVITELRKGAYDAVIVFGWGDLTSWLAFAGASFTGVPWVLYGDSIILYEDGKGWLKQQVKRFVLGTLFKKTSAFLTMGKLNRLYYRRYGASPDKFFFMPYPVDNQFFHERAMPAKRRREELRAQHGIPSGAVLVLFVGKLVARKRPQDLLAALQILQPSIPELAIAFAGEGELRASLEARISGLKNIYMLGFKNQTKLPEVYGMADILVLPSSEENWGLVLNEAMASGMPVIASDKTGAAADLVKSGENGFVYPCGKIAALAEAIRKLAADPDLRQRMGTRSHDIIQDFGYEKCLEGIVRAVKFIDRQKRIENGE